ncbi:hypothetical protein [Mycoplasmoides alvi]|uniref:hypothetical protein n=1 Tax=Mycoplasmoides alvi TaxID=78580 RepID=UPI00051B87AA|nr:hypothetical protein [Mycoplasmoides alvi]
MSKKKSNKDNKSLKNDLNINENNFLDDLHSNITRISSQIVNTSDLIDFVDDNKNYFNKNNTKATSKNNKYEKLFKVKNQLFKVKSNRSKTTIVPGITISLDNSIEPVKDFVAQTNEDYLDKDSKLSDFVDSKNFNKDFIEKDESFGLNLNNEFYKYNEMNLDSNDSNELIIPINYDDSNVNLNSNENLNKEMIFSSSLKNVDNSKDYDCFQENNEIIKPYNFAKNTTEQLESLSSKIDSLIYNTKEIKKEHLDQCDMVVEEEDANKEMAVPPPFIHVPIPDQSYNDDLINIKQENGSFD